MWNHPLFSMRLRRKHNYRARLYLGMACMLWFLLSVISVRQWTVVIPILPQRLQYISIDRSWVSRHSIEYRLQLNVKLASTLFSDYFQPQVPIYTPFSYTNCSIPRQETTAGFPSHLATTVLIKCNHIVLFWWSFLFSINLDMEHNV